MKNYAVPKLYLTDYINNFEEKIKKYHLKTKTYKYGEVLTSSDTLNNTAHFIRSGMVHLSITHSSGNTKSLTFFGSNTIFPFGTVAKDTLIDYEVVLRAFTDAEICSFSYSQLRQMCMDDGTFAAELLEESNDFTGYLFYNDLNTAYASSYVKVCDILYLYLFHVCPIDASIPVTQDELAHLAGISKAQLERVLKELRDKNIIKTSRKRIIIPDHRLLFAECSYTLKENPYAR